jgi:hypothetical protein
MRMLTLADPDKYSEADCGPDMMTHCISFLGFVAATLIVLWLSGGTACIMDVGACGKIPTQLNDVHLHDGYPNGGG